jgi:hypothetical protein
MRKSLAGQTEHATQTRAAGDPGGHQISEIQSKRAARKKSAGHRRSDAQRSLAGDAPDHVTAEAQTGTVEGDPIADQPRDDAQKDRVGNGADLGHVAREAHVQAAEIRATIAEVVSEARKNAFAIRSRMRTRQSMLSYISRVYFGYHTGLKETERTKAISAAEKLIKAIEKGGTSHPSAMIVRATGDAAKPWEEIERETEKLLVKLARNLPAYAWVKQVRGFGALSFARIIAETGDLSGYDNPAKVWKRLGLAVIDGRAQRRTRDKEGAAEQGYSPRRRAVAYVAFEPVIKAQSVRKESGGQLPSEAHGSSAAGDVSGQEALEDQSSAAAASAVGAGQMLAETQAIPAGPYRQMYDRKKAEYLARVEAGEEGWSKLRAHRAAMRYASKALYRDLWIAWRKDVAGHGGAEAQMADAGDGARDGQRNIEAQMRTAVPGAPIPCLPKQAEKAQRGDGRAKGTGGSLGRS